MAPKYQRDFKLNVITGKALTAMAASVRGWERRECYTRLQAYLRSEDNDRVCLLYGLYGTGKETMFRQAILDMSPGEAARSAYIKATPSDSMASLNHDLKLLFAQEYRFILIDEVTRINGFIESAALLSDIYAAQGMKIVLSGTNSLSFWSALHQELYDRAVMLHTTFIPFREYSRLRKIDSIDEYIRYGGILHEGKIDNSGTNTADASFLDGEATRRYIDCAICKNIRHTLAHGEDDGRLRHLHALNKAGELTGAINQVIEDLNLRFLLSALAGDNAPHVLRLTRLLERRSKDEQSIPPEHVAEIEECLIALELIVNCPIETAEPGAEPIEHILFTQPGMRYCQAQALVHSLMKDQQFAGLSEYEKKAVTDRILEEVRGRMMEEIVLLETSKALSRQYRVFKLQFAAGEFDMVIYDTQENKCGIYEIKHSGQAVPEQYRHLMDPEKRRQTERRFGEIAQRCVLYRGAELQMENGVRYQNVETFLKDIPAEALRISQDGDVTQVNQLSL